MRRRLPPRLRTPRPISLSNRGKACVDGLKPPTLVAMRSFILPPTRFFLGLLAAPFFYGAAAEPVRNVKPLVSFLMESESELKGIPFAEVVQAVAGKRIIAINPTHELDRVLLARIGGALDKVLARMNAPDSPAQKPKRINEPSSHFENAIKTALNEIPGFDCDFPKTAAGKTQRSGYPDLRLVDKVSGRVFYLDPKLYAAGNRSSSLRTFYFEPKKETNKINDDAHHLIVGFEHDGGSPGQWKYFRWELVDLSGFQVRLKAEFQGSNKDLYRPEAIVGRSQK
jgi:hypothetical protein